MRSVREWLFGPTKPEKDEAKAEAITPEITKAARWVSTGNGSYVKVLSATTEQPASEPVSDKLQTSGKSAESLSNSDEHDKKTNDEHDEKTNNSTNDAIGIYGNDAISLYQSQLDNAILTEREKLAKWKQVKEEIIGSDKTLNSYPSNRNIDVHHNAKNAIASYFKKLFNQIKESVLPANMDLHHLLEKAHNEMKSLYDHLEVSCTTIREHKSEAEQRKMTVDMCDTSIDIINDRIQMLDEIRNEINYCLKFEIITEAVASAIFELGLFVILKMPIPKLNFDFSDTYRHTLYGKIIDEKKEIDKFETDVSGLLNRGMTIIQLLEKGWEEIKLNKSVPLPTLTGGADKLLLLPAPPKQMNDNQTNDKDQPSLSPAPT